MITKSIKKEFLHNITKHGVISGFYFNYIIKKILELILTNKKVKILDFGCGYGYLKKRLKKARNVKIINFDIIKELTEIDDWRKVDFNYLVSTHVFMYLGPKKLNKLLLDLKRHNKNLKLITTISRQGLLNNIGKFILNEPDAHKGTLLNGNNELKLLKKKMRMFKKKNIFCLSDIYLLKFL